MRRVLVAPLDWGLGHTARCVPVIQELIKAGHSVFFAGNKDQQSFIHQHHLQVKTIDLFGYDVSYSAIFPQWMKVGFQSLRLKKIIDKENQWLEETIKEHKIDIVISDNRFGLHNLNVHCIFITHQLNIPSPLFARNINNINADYINKFNECWIPDTKILSLSGQLSAKTELKIPMKYVGLLSRFHHPKSDFIAFDAAFLLSGVEPQRSMLEQKLIDLFQHSNCRIALIRGTTEELTNLPHNVQQFNLLNSDELIEVLSQSDVVVCRSGYSSIMDLVKLHKKMFLIPTPGQPEQEYLAEYLNEKFGIPFIEQSNIHKQGINLSEAKAIDSAFGIKNENLLEEAISQIQLNK